MNGEAAKQWGFTVLKKKSYKMQQDVNMRERMYVCVRILFIGNGVKASLY